MSSAQWIERGCGLVIAVIAAGNLAGHASAQDITTTVEVSTTRSFVPLQSYVYGKAGSSILFFGGLSDMGLHLFGEGAFPISNFNTDIVLVNATTGAVMTGATDHLPAVVREALRVTAAQSVQFGDTMHVYGGYGPLLDGSDYTTRATVTSIDLAQVASAILASSPVPASAFTVQACLEGKVCGGGIVKLGDGDRFALICGADAEGDYANSPDPEYSAECHVFDRTVSLTTPVTTFNDGLGFDSPMHRRDVNVAGVTLPDGAGTRDGFVVVCGVFRNGIFTFENPLIWGDGDAEVTEDELFVQHMGAYEGPLASLYSASRATNHILNYAGLSGYNWVDGEFMWNPATPWTVEAVDITIVNGVFSNEVVIGASPWPITNAKMVVEGSLPVNALGQVLVDQLPLDTPVLLGRIYGGIAAEMAGEVSPTYASDDVYDVFITVAGPPSTLPAAFTRVRGLPVSGGLSDLFTDDDSRLVTRPDVFRPSAIPPVQIEVTSTASVEAPAELRFLVESRASVNNIRQRVLLFNYDTNQYDLVDTRVLATTDGVVEEIIAGAGAAAYVQNGTRQIKSLLQYNAVAFSILPTWRAEQDRAVWRIVE